LTIEDDLAYLVGETIPPPNTADFFLFSLDAVAQRKYGGGSGEPNDPYLIYTAEQMNAIGAEPNDWDKHFKLMADIDLNSYSEDEFNIIGTDRFNPFTGVFDGNGHKIYNFKYSSTDKDNTGLFGRVQSSAKIRDLGLIDPNVDAGSGRRVGVLVGILFDGTITGCYAQGGRVSGNDWYVGGLVGVNYGLVDNCYFTGNVRGGWSTVGGLVGFNYGKITDCHSDGEVAGRSDVGGLVGRNYASEESSSGRAVYGTISRCGTTADVSGTSLDVGGFVGTNSGTIGNSYATGSVTGNADRVGGFIGDNSGHISACCATGSVHGKSLVGGLIGFHIPYGKVSNCYSSSEVFGTILVGGLVGMLFDGVPQDPGTISNCYSTGQVSADARLGGLVGEGTGSGDAVINSFWNVETSGLSTSDGGIGKMTAEMQMEGTFTYAGWDFVAESVNGAEDIWSICEGTNYPRLLWQIPAGDFVCPDGITIEDFVFFIEHWRDETCDPSNDYCQCTDLDFSGTVDEADLEILIENWLAGVRSD